VILSTYLWFVRSMLFSMVALFSASSTHIPLLSGASLTHPRCCMWYFPVLPDYAVRLGVSADL
jgi:hypothetical protein